MQKFYEIFKNKAVNRDITREDMLARCVYKALTSKSDDKISVLHGLLKKTFTPGRICAHRYHKYQAIIESVRTLKWQVKPSRKYSISEKKIIDCNGFLLDLDVYDVLTEEEYNIFKELLSSIEVNAL